MFRRLIHVLAVAMLFLAVVSSDAQTAGQQRQSAPAAAAPAVAPLDNALPTQYCTGCHNQRAKTAGLMLDSMDYSNIGKDAATWEKVVRKIKTGMMPPSGARRPERAALDAFAVGLETRLDRAAALSPNPGSPVLHRLNRTEYANAIRDLLAFDVDVTTLLPPDDSS